MPSELVLRRKTDPKYVDQIGLICPEFNVKFYELQLTLINFSSIDPISHYLTEGWKIGLDPSPSFSNDAYLEVNVDVKKAGMNPLLHYVMSGKEENRHIQFSRKLINDNEYLELQRKIIEGHFDQKWYMSRYAASLKNGQSAIDHFLRIGWKDGNDPSPKFDLSGYWAQNDCLEKENINPLIHCVVFGNNNQASYRQEEDKEFHEEEEVLLADNLHEDISQVVTIEETVGKEQVTSNIESLRVPPSSVIQRLKAQRMTPKVVPRSFAGNIEGVRNGKVYGWIVAPAVEVTPVLFVDGKPIVAVEYPVKRNDVSECLGISGDSGFVFDVGAIQKGVRLSLFALFENRLVPIVESASDEQLVEDKFIPQLTVAKQISNQKNAVAITCWDAGHNPIGRAKVLYDVVSSNRPALIVAYLFDGFGGKIWEPVRTSNIKILTIPWKNREIYHKAIRQAGIQFETVWVCKSRYPGFELADLVSKPDSSIILDFDDNEDHFSKSPGALRKAYGLPTINLSRSIAKRIEGRTAASITLKKEFGAVMLRHARHSHVDNQAFQNVRSDDIVSVGFVGTVRAHKRLLDAARAIRSFTWSTGIKAELHVYGDVKPQSLVKELERNGVSVKQNIPMEKLAECLQEMDVILTGFSGTGEAEKEVTKYQISSKIGDALSVGKPVLVPSGPSVADLSDVPGLFLFDQINFSDMLYKALSFKGRTLLPAEFTTKGAYSAFVQAEGISNNALKAKGVFHMLSTSKEHGKLVPTLVLLWKQNDSGFYGRRIDQIARSYKKINHSHRVVILELMHAQTEKDHSNAREDYTSESQSLLGLVADKRRGRNNGDKVELHQIKINRSDDVPEELETYLLRESILPDNATFVIFPIIQFYSKMKNTLDPYCKIMDVVDNQFAWGGAEKQRERVMQYYAIARTSDAAVFNSQQNLNYFVDNNVLKETTDCKVIPNWYELPSDFDMESTKNNNTQGKNIIYSGNMNDRIDWELLSLIAESHSDVDLHLVGTASRGIDNLEKILSKVNVIYHGPLSEHDTLRLTSKMDLAIMPHKIDDVSIFMNPLKVHMYKALGIPTISTNVPGITENEILKITSSHMEFLDAICESLESTTVHVPIAHNNSEIFEYIDIIERVQATRGSSQLYRTNAA